MALEEVVVIAHPRVERLPLWGPWGRDPPTRYGTSA